jgi:hypothetical protein
MLRSLPKMNIVTVHSSPRKGPPYYLRQNPKIIAKKLASADCNEAKSVAGTDFSLRVKSRSWRRPP